MQDAMVTESLARLGGELVRKDLELSSKSRGQHMGRIFSLVMSYIFFYILFIFILWV